MTKNLKFVSVALLLLMTGLSPACEDEAVPLRVPTNKKATAAESGTPSTGLIEAKGDEASSNALALPPLTETSFIDGPTRRDPFAPFVEVLKKQERIVEHVQRKVKLEEYDISALRLIGIITNIGDPRAMVTTPDNKGYVIKRGDFIGRADYVTQSGGDDVIQVNWRVARIHGTGKEEERGVYLVRDDPTTSRGVDVTRFIPLHPAE